MVKKSKIPLLFVHYSDISVSLGKARLSKSWSFHRFFRFCLLLSIHRAPDGLSWSWKSRGWIEFSKKKKKRLYDEEGFGGAHKSLYQGQKWHFIQQNLWYYFIKEGTILRIFFLHLLRLDYYLIQWVNGGLLLTWLCNYAPNKMCFHLQLC